jgi:hypothetical protein
MSLESITALSLCKICSELSIQTLVALAEDEFSGHAFPQRAYFSHHNSMAELEEAAHHGCEFCQLVLQCFQYTPTTEENPSEWPSGWEKPAVQNQDNMYAVAMALQDSNVKLAINAEHVFFGDTLDSVQVLDTIIVQLGPVYDDTEDGDDEVWQFPPLRLILSSAKGSCAL